MITTRDIGIEWGCRRCTTWNLTRESAVICMGCGVADWNTGQRQRRWTQRKVPDKPFVITKQMKHDYQLVKIHSKLREDLKYAASERAKKSKPKQRKKRR